MDSYKPYNNTLTLVENVVLMSLHLGFHWRMMMGMARRIIKELPSAGRWMLRGIAALVAGYGVYAFIRREIGHSMFLQNIFFLINSNMDVLLLFQQLIIVWLLLIHLFIELK